MCKGFAEDTKIIMGDCTIRNIADISPGDFVIDQYVAEQKIISISKSKANYNIIKISNNVDLKCGIDQQLFNLNIVSDMVSKSISRLLFSKKTIKQYAYSNINACGRLLSPIIEATSNRNLTPEQCRLLGLYAAEGSLDKSHGTYRNVVVFTFSAKEKDTLAQLTRNLLLNCFPNCRTTIKVNKHKCTVCGYCKNIQDFFLEYVGEYSKNKFVHSDIMFSEYGEQFILGWLEGDGNIDRKLNRITGTTISDSLAFQIRHMLINRGQANCLYRVIPSKSTIQGREIIGKHPVYRLRINSSYFSNVDSPKYKKAVGKFVKSNKFVDGYCMFPILGITENQYPIDLYSLEVENNSSFIANSMIVV